MSSEKLVKTPFKEKLKHELVGRGFVTVCGSFILTHSESDYSKI